MSILKRKLKQFKDAPKSNKESDMDIYQEESETPARSLSEAVLRKLSKGGLVDENAGYDEMNEIAGMDIAHEYEDTANPDASDEHDMLMPLDEDSKDEKRMQLVDRILSRLRNK